MSYFKYLPCPHKYIISFHRSISGSASLAYQSRRQNPSSSSPIHSSSESAIRAATSSNFYCNMSVKGKIATTEKHDLGSGRIVLETSSGSSIRGSQTEFASLPPPYDGRHASLTRSMTLQAHATVQKYSTQRQRTLHRRSPQPFQRSTLPKDGMSQGVALQLKGEGETESNAAWKKQVRADRIALNALIEADQEREAKAVPEDGGNGEDLSDFNARYQEYLGRRGLSNIEQLTRHTERLFDEL